MKSNVSTCSIVPYSFEQVGLCHRTLYLFRELCQEHCSTPSPLESVSLERKLDQLMNDIRAERGVERYLITALCELVTAKTCKKEGLRPLRKNEVSLIVNG